MNPARVARQHVRDEMGWPGVRIPEVRREPAGTSLVVVRARSGSGVRWCWGVRVGRGGDVLDDVVLLHDRPSDGGAEMTTVRGRSR